MALSGCLKCRVLRWLNSARTWGVSALPSHTSSRGLRLFFCRAETIWATCWLSAVFCPV